MFQVLRPAVILGVLAAVFGVAMADRHSSRVAAAERMTSVLVRDVPHVKRKPDFGGEACAEMWLRRQRISADQDYVFDQSGLDPLLGRGCYTNELTLALQRMGFRTGEVYTSIPARTAEPLLDKAFAELHSDLKRGMPSIVCMNSSDRAKASERFRLVVGYDEKSDEVIYHDPAVDEGAHVRMERQQFFKLWPLKYTADTWTLVRITLDPGKLPTMTAAAANEFTAADYAQHIRELRQRLPHDGFSIVIQKPFVVVGDEPLETVRRRADDTVKWAVDLLKQDYFTKDPNSIIDIWLFQDAPSYEEHTEKLIHRKPTTRYGFYSPSDKALFMNIATGGGTLVHEIVHPFMASNFPGCPSWFNEGLASLYEQAGERDGHIIGQTNWRLRGLQTAIRKDSVPSFETLCSTTTREFYDRDKGTNYSQARYLCYYLQEHGLLIKYYHAFRKNSATDPTGYKTLKSVLGGKDMSEFKERWEAEVLKLEF